MVDHKAIIKQSVTMRMVAEHYQFKINRESKIRCPFHNDKNASLKIYDENKGFYCWGCSKGGDVIKFVQLNENLSLIETLKWFDATFHLKFGTTGKINDFDGLRWAIKNLTKEIDLLIEEGQNIAFHNKLAIVLGLEFKDINKARLEYKEKLIKLNKLKKKLFSGKYNKKIEEFIK